MTPTMQFIGQALLCCALMGQGATLAAAPLGRLFSTPAERQQLDALRNNPGTAPAGTMAAAPAEPQPGAAAPAAEQLVVDGVLRRSSGKNTVWINQQARDNVRLSGKAGKTAVQLKLQSGQRVSLKAGQRYDMDAAKVKDANEP